VLAPSPVLGITNAVAISASDNDTCAMLADGTVQCWGSPLQTYPSPVQGLTGAKALAHRCALLTDGSVSCWLFGNTMTAQTVPGLVGTATAIADRNPTTGAFEVCVVASDGSVQCQGEHFNGTLYDGTPSNSDGFVPVQGLPGPAVGVAVGDAFSCAALRSGQVWCWGQNSALGLSSTAPVMTPLAPL